MINTGAGGWTLALALVLEIDYFLRTLTHLVELRESNEILLKNNEIFMKIFQVLNFISIVAKPISAIIFSCLVLIR